MWRPYLSNVSSTLSSLLSSTPRSSSSSPSWSPWRLPSPVRPSLIIVGALLWDLLYQPDTLQLEIEKWQQNIQRVTNTQTSSSSSSSVEYRPSLLFLTASSLLDSALSGHRHEATQFRDQQVQEWNKQLARNSNDNIQQQQEQQQSQWKMAWLPQYQISHAIIQQQQQEQRDASGNVTIANAAAPDPATGAVFSAVDPVFGSVWRSVEVSDGVHSSVSAASVASVVLSVHTCQWLRHRDTTIQHGYFSRQRITPSQGAAITITSIIIAATAYAILCKHTQTHTHTKTTTTTDHDSDGDMGMDRGTATRQGGTNEYEQYITTHHNTKRHKNQK